MLQAIRGWALADLRAWPKEHQKLRLMLVFAGLEAASVGWIAVAMLGVPANVPSAKVRLEAVSSLWFGLGLLVVLFLSGAPFVFYVRYVRTLPATLLTGLALIFLIVYAFGFMVTSTSAKAGMAILYPFFLNYFVFAGGLGLDRVVGWIGAHRGGWRARLRTARAVRSSGRCNDPPARHRSAAYAAAATISARATEPRVIPTE